MHSEAAAVRSQRGNIRPGSLHFVWEWTASNYISQNQAIISGGISILIAVIDGLVEHLL